MAIQLLQQLFKAAEHDVDGFFAACEIAPHKRFEFRLITVLLAPEISDLSETLLCPPALPRTMLGDKFFLESRFRFINEF